MKKLFLVLAVIFFSSSDIYYQAQYVPILMNRVQLEASVQLTDTAMIIRNPGRIYMYQNWLLVVEKYKGIHLIDNLDPANPVRKGFLRVPGCLSMAVGNNTLYVDNAVDLVGIKINLNTMLAHEVARNKKALPEINSPEGYLPWKYSRSNRPVNTEIIGWTQNTAGI